MNNTGNDRISGGGEGDKDDAVIDSPHPRTEMGQTIDFDLGQCSHVHGNKGNNFWPERQMRSPWEFPELLENVVVPMRNCFGLSGLFGSFRLFGLDR